MNQRMMLAILAGLALGVLIFLINLSQGFDLAGHNATLESLRALKQYDSRLNEETLRARLLIDPDSTTLVDMLPEVGKAVDSLNKGTNAIEHLGDAKLNKAYADYKGAMTKKLEQVEQFEGDNLALAESIDTIRRGGEEILNALPAVPKYADVRQQVLQLLKEVLEYGLLPAPENAKKLEELSLDFSKVAVTLPLELQGQTVQLSSRTNSVLNQRQMNDQLLASILSAPTSSTLSTLQNAYDNFHSQRLKGAEIYRQILLMYVVALLAGLVYLGWRLRKSYSDLNKANVQLARANETLEVKVTERTKDLTKAYAALKSTQAQVVQTEKMASLGQMVAGVAHEINTPLGFVRSNIELVGGMFQEISELFSMYARTVGLIRAPNADEKEITEAFNKVTVAEAEMDPQLIIEEAGMLLKEGRHGLDRINELVLNLKDFSRLDRSRKDLFDINAGLDSTLIIARNTLKDRIEIVKDYGVLPQIEGSPSQINQVFLNMLTNASQAIEGDGTISLTTRTDGSNVFITIEDTGCGMTPDVMKKIYDPFFTTKEVGKGTGLGLSIVHQIIEEHRGKIEVESSPGNGSKFTITLPTRQQAESGMPVVSAA